MAGLADESPVVIQVGEDFEENFDRELENYPKLKGTETKSDNSLPFVRACGVRWIASRACWETTGAVRLCLGGIPVVGWCQGRLGGAHVRHATRCTSAFTTGSFLVRKLSHARWIRRRPLERT